jgi:hypothetical protein
MVTGIALDTTAKTLQVQSAPAPEPQHTTLHLPDQPIGTNPESPTHLRMRLLSFLGANLSFTVRAHSLLAARSFATSS